MKLLGHLIRRNTKLFFKDKGMFFTSLVTPLIVLLLFVTFLGNIYRDTFQSYIPKGLEIPETLIEGFVGGWLFSSLLAVCCVTVAFCANMIMVQDKVSGARKDLTIAPVKSPILALGYYISTALITLIICLAASSVCVIYLKKVGWYLSIQDILLMLLDIVLMVLFGTALSSLINFFLSTQGQISAVSTIVSAAYGFICGAYMPISQFSNDIQTVISFLPGTYGTSLLHNHLMRGVLNELEGKYFPEEAIKAIQDSFDNNLYFLEHKVEITQMYFILSGTIVVLLLLYVLVNIVKKKE